MGIQWMVRWWVLVHFRPSVVVLSLDHLARDLHSKLDNQIESLVHSWDSLSF
jgi:hypothetical protein